MKYLFFYFKTDVGFAFYFILLNKKTKQIAWFFYIFKGLSSLYIFGEINLHF